MEKGKFAIHLNLCCLFGLICCEKVYLEYSLEAPSEPEPLGMKILGAAFLVQFGSRIFIFIFDYFFFNGMHSCM